MYNMFSPLLLLSHLSTSFYVIFSFKFFRVSVVFSKVKEILSEKEICDFCFLLLSFWYFLVFDVD